MYISVKSVIIVLNVWLPGCEIATRRTAQNAGRARNACSVFSPPIPKKRLPAAAAPTPVKWPSRVGVAVAVRCHRKNHLFELNSTFHVDVLEGVGIAGIGIKSFDIRPESVNVDIIIDGHDRHLLLKQ